MSAPDPQTVREIARKLLTEFMDRYPMVDAFFVGGRVLEACGDPELWQTDPQAYRDWCDAVVADVRLAVPSWPDEQQPADPVSGEQQDGAAEAVRRIYERRVEHGYKTADYDDDDIVAVLDNREAWRNLARSRGVERDALAARVAELEAELAPLREWQAALDEAQVSLQSSSFERGWWKGFKAMPTAGVHTQAYLDTVEYADELRALATNAAPDGLSATEAGERPTH